MTTNRIFALFFIMLLVASLAGSVHGAAPRGIEDRIRSAIEFVEGQLQTAQGADGFMHATVAGQPQTMYTEDASLVALALSAYQESHYSQEFYPYLKTSVEFIESAQTGSGDFYEYYDVANQTWLHSGHLYYSDAYTMMGPAYAAFVVTSQAESEKEYWASVIDKLRGCVDFWVPIDQTANGSIIFSFPDGSTRADVAANAALLVSLTYIALFEYNWGDRNLATKYASWSQNIAVWLASLQEKNQSAWGFGGFYSDQNKTVQAAFENGLIMFGLDSYYKAASLLLQNPQPSISDLRQVMIDWMVGYVEKMFDSWGGAQYERTEGGVISYPKTTLAVSSMLQATVDVWINIGPEVYWNDSSRLYEWMTGHNELSLDLQGTVNTAGSGGGFYAGIDRNGTMAASDLGVVALALYAMIRAAYVSIPGDYPVSFTTPTTRTSSTTLPQTTEVTTEATTTRQQTAENNPYVQYGLLVIISVAIIVGALGVTLKRFKSGANRRKRSLDAATRPVKAAFPC